MSKNYLLLPIFLVCFSIESFGNDSTLYLQRISKIKLLFKDLAALKMFRIHSLNDTLRINGYYTQVLAKHIVQPAPPSEYSLDYSAYDIHPVLGSIDIDNLVLLYPDPSKDSIVDTRPFKHYLANTIILFLPMYEGVSEGAYFSFKEGSDQMLYFISAGGEDIDYRKKKYFLDAVGRTHRP